jgi:hypothetical protein
MIGMLRAYGGGLYVAGSGVRQLASSGGNAAFTAAWDQAYGVESRRCARAASQGSVSVALPTFHPFFRRSFVPFSLSRPVRVVHRSVVLAIATALVLTDAHRKVRARGVAASENLAHGSDAFPRVVKHELGETEIPAKPERIVAVTDGGEFASLLALGVEPVGFGKRNDRRGSGSRLPRRQNRLLRPCRH